MFERFTDRARKVVARANDIARQAGDDSIERAHILLAFLTEDDGVGAAVLRNLGFDIERRRQEIETSFGTPTESKRSRKLLPAGKGRKVIEHAIEESRGLNHNYVGTEHFLLGLIRTEAGEQLPPLLRLGVNLDDARREIERFLGGGQSPYDLAEDP